MSRQETASTANRRMVGQKWSGAHPWEIYHRHSYCCSKDSSSLCRQPPSQPHAVTTMHNDQDATCPRRCHLLGLQWTCPELSSANGNSFVQLAKGDSGHFPLSKHFPNSNYVNKVDELPQRFLFKYTVSFLTVDCSRCKTCDTQYCDRFHEENYRMTFF